MDYSRRGQLSAQAAVSNSVTMIHGTLSLKILCVRILAPSVIMGSPPGAVRSTEIHCAIFFGAQLGDWYFEDLGKLRRVTVIIDRARLVRCDAGCQKVYCFRERDRCGLRSFSGQRLAIIRFLVKGAVRMVARMRIPTLL